MSSKSSCAQEKRKDDKMNKTLRRHDQDCFLGSRDVRLAMHSASDGASRTLIVFDKRASERGVIPTVLACANAVHPALKFAATLVGWSEFWAIGGKKVLANMQFHKLSRS